MSKDQIFGLPEEYSDGDHELIENAQDWEWYKAELDVADHYKYKHVGVPENYPCVVSSEWDSGGEGPYIQYHSFIYKTKVVCPHCGSVQFVWPDLTPKDVEV
jgi:hypothetical protein